MKKVISTPKAPAAIGPYSQAIEVNGMVYTSGIIPVVPETGEIPEGIRGTGEAGTDKPFQSAFGSRNQHGQCGKDNRIH